MNELTLMIFLFGVFKILIANPDLISLPKSGILCFVHKLDFCRK